MYFNTDYIHVGNLNFEIMHSWLCKPERQNNGSVLVGCTSRHDGPIQQEKL